MGLWDEFQQITRDIEGNEELAKGDDEEFSAMAEDELPAVVHCLTGSGGASQKSPWRGWCYRYNLDGTATPTCPGIRSPGGIGFNKLGGP